ncbi:hypothetical protein AnigIFM56816_005980 [Aspergillus niger]|nr:hypothetical protein AnigIFM56816_005980 [Aspergillus niger]
MVRNAFQSFNYWFHLRFVISAVQIPYEVMAHERQREKQENYSGLTMDDTPAGSVRRKKHGVFRRLIVGRSRDENARLTAPEPSNDTVEPDTKLNPTLQQAKLCLFSSGLE